MQLNRLCSELNELLGVESFVDIDISPNGLQVGPEIATIDRVAFAVDAAAATIEAAIEADADLLVTHHGLWLDGPDYLTGHHFNRVSRLIEGELALYVSHLPLDAHPELGNAAGVADLIDLQQREEFGQYDGDQIGQCGQLATSTSRSKIADILEAQLVGVRDIHLLPFGPDPVDSVAIVTGSGVDWLEEAVSIEADLFITGEGKQHLYHEAREAEINVLMAGHYATETTGIRSLATVLEEWGLETTVIDHPTGL